MRPHSSVFENLTPDQLRQIKTIYEDRLYYLADQKKEEWTRLTIPQKMWKIFYWKIKTNYWYYFDHSRYERFLENACYIR